MTNRVFKKLNHSSRIEAAEIELLIDDGTDGMTMEAWCKLCKSYSIRTKKLKSGSLGTLMAIFGSKHHLRFFLNKFDDKLFTMWWTTY